MQTLYSKPNFLDFCPWICAQGHQGIHGFIGMSMAATMQSPDDPFFWLHHCNVDRFLHLYWDCLEYDLVSKDSLTPTHFTNINPTTTSSQPAKKDGVPIVFTLDYVITLYLSSNRAPTYLPAANFPTSRQLWTLGSATTTSSDWNGLRYRYGADDLAQSAALNSVCKPGNVWRYVNWGATGKRSEEEPSDPYITDLYRNITDTFFYLTEEKGMTPQAAVDKMAWDKCMANPRVITEETKTFLRGIGLTPMDTQRICDNPVDLKLSKEEMENWYSVDHMSHHME
jgi:hypothetical protein